MKNIGITFGILGMMIVVSCGKKEEKTTDMNTTKETTVQKTVVVDTVAAKPATDPNGTSVKVGSNGVEVKSKSGANNTSIEVKK